MFTTVRTRQFARATLFAVATAATLLLLPTTVRAQDAAKIYNLNEVDAMPKLTSQAYMARIMQDAYPAALKKAGIGGAVQMEFVVDEKGKVDISTVDVVATNPGLADAAKQVAPKLEFSPAKVKGTPVKSRVVLPLVFKP